MSSFSSFLIAVLVGCLWSLELTVNISQAFPWRADEEELVTDPVSFGFLWCSHVLLMREAASIVSQGYFYVP